MKRLSTACFLCLGLTMTFVPLPASGAKLPGARPVIDAAEYPSLQAAIDAVPLDGGMLRLPPGEFVISEPLVIRHEDFRMEGAGTATHIRNTNAEGQPAIVVRADAFEEKNPLKRRPLWRISLADFRLTGNEKSGHGIEVNNVNELFVQGVTLSYHGGDGIRCHACYEDMRLSDSLITYNRGAGFRAEGNHDTIVSACQFEENNDAVVFTDGFNLTLTGNNIDDHLRHGVVIENTMGSLVTGNMIEQCSGAALVLARDAYGISVSGNTFAQNFGGGADLRDAHGVPIAGNTFLRCKQFGVRITAQSGRSVISGNTFCDTFIGEGPKVSGPRGDDADLNAAAGILLEGTRDVTITGNTLSGLVTRPLTRTGDCERILYENNQAIDCAEVDAKATKVLSTGWAGPLSTRVGTLELIAKLHDPSALARVHDIEVRSGRAYLAGKGGSLAIVDVKQPAEPKLLWSVRDEEEYDEAETVMPLGDDRLLVGTRDVLLWNVAQPAQPGLLSRISDRTHVDLINGFARTGDTVFAACKIGHIAAIDVSNTDTIRLLGARETRERGELGLPHDAVFCGDLLVVVSPEGFGDDSKPGRLAVYRVIDATSGQVLPPQQWELMSKLEHPRLAGANRLVTRGKFAIVGCSLRQNSDRADDMRNNVSIVDLTDPAHPRLRGSLDFPDARGPNGLEIAGRVVLAAGGQTVQAIDVGTPDAPCELARFTSAEVFPGGADDAHDLVCVDGHLFVTAQNSHNLIVLRAAIPGLSRP
ncbi:MAG: right-handed parallel beta-helix repeat-containing protein [Planctomycetota bacterium]